MSGAASRSLSRKLGFALVAATLALGLVELGLRTVAWVAGQDWRSPPLPEHTDYPVVCPMGDEILRLCPEEGHGYERVRPEMFLERSEAPRVITIGESFVFGLGLDVQQAVPARLEERLGGQAEVLNWGRCGAYAGKLMPAVHAAIALDPDLIVLAIGNNEHTMTSFYTGWPARHPVAFYGVSEALGRLQLFGLLTRAIGGGLPQPSEVYELRVTLDDPVARAAYSARRRPPDLSLFEDALASPEVTRLLEQEQRLKERIFRNRLREMVDQIQAEGIAVVLATLPHRMRTPPVLSGIYDGDPDTVRRIARDLLQGGGRPERALSEGLSEDPKVAMFQHGWGEHMLSIGDRDAAIAAFRAQAEWDLVPDGTPGLNAIVREVAGERGCALADLEPLSQHSLDPSTPMFLDRVHVDEQGAVLMAEALEPVVRDQLGLGAVERGGD